MHKISYTIVKKNKYPNAPWYVRKRETGEKPVDVNLETTDRKAAETELMRVKVAASEGSNDPLGALSILQKWAQEPVSRPNGVLDGWVDWMRLEGFREQSISKYERAVRMLLDGKSVADLTPDLVRNIMANKVNLKANTRRGYADSLHRLFDYLKRPDLAEALPRIKTEVTDRPVWTKEEMLEIILHVSTKKAARTDEPYRFPPGRDLRAQVEGPGPGYWSHPFQGRDDQGQEGTIRPVPYRPVGGTGGAQGTARGISMA